MYSFIRSTSKGVAYLLVGGIVIASGGTAAPFIGGAFLGSGGYSVVKATIRGAREIADEDAGEMYFVHYDLDNVLVKVGNYVLPDQLLPDRQVSHWKAWFTLSATSYVTFEITAGKSSGVIAEKYNS